MSDEINSKLFELQKQVDDLRDMVQSLIEASGREVVSDVMRRQRLRRAARTRIGLETDQDHG